MRPIITAATDSNAAGRASTVPAPEMSPFAMIGRRVRSVAQARRSWTRRPPALVLEEAGVQRDRVHAGVLDQTQPLGEPRLAVGRAVAQPDLDGERSGPGAAQLPQHHAERRRIVEERAAGAERADAGARRTRG
jgi:hypothetical protein